MARTAKQRRWRIQRLRKRDGFHCWLCGAAFQRRHPLGPVTIDHAISKGRGGTNDMHNLRLAHERCNQERGMIVITPPRAVRSRLLAMKIPMSVLELTPDMIVGSAELASAA